jgi:stress-induced morphogen
MMTKELTFCHCISPSRANNFYLSLGAYDDPNGSHISIVVVSDKFEGKRAVQRQQMVYKAIWEELAGPVHAVDSMICKTPTEE